jgi:hypothetical protein
MSRSLNELEPPDWGEAPPDATGLVRGVHAARQKPLAELTVEDLRVLIGQNVSLDHLVPLALRELHEDPLSEGDLYPGDLLNAVLNIDGAFWGDHGELALEVDGIVHELESALETLQEPIAEFRFRAYGIRPA